ncbi:MAG: flagellar biosynthesis protein FlhB [Butyribacter sp.]|nr:flagellar biosynthesis protein FlhB [Butyribacter sp.]
MPYLKYDLQLFAKEGSGGEKTEEPTAKKLEDARKKGQAAKSVDLTAAITLLVFFAIMKVYIGLLGNKLLENYSMFYRHIADRTNDQFTLQLACSMLGEVIMRVIELMIPFGALAFFTVVISMLVQVKWKISTEPMKPKLSKINPVSGVKRLFSKDKLVMLVMSIAKQIIMVAVVYSVLSDKWNLLIDLYHFSLEQSLAVIGDIIIDIGLRISIFFFVIGAADAFYQKWKFHQDMKMTKQEVKDEYKQAEGDPKVKGKQRQVMRQASQRRMMNALPEADVVITNPTHLAVALKYDKDQYDAPVVIAKGADYLAERIKNVAREHDIEIVENKPLARMLYHNVELGDQIPPELYQMVAEVLAYVYGLKNNR